MKCPGQDSRYWKPGAIFEEKCPECGHLVEFFKDDTTRKCPKCEHKFANPKMDFGCASYCQYAKECIGDLPPELLAQKEDLLKDRIAIEMKRYFKSDFKRIGHATRVARYAERIGRNERGNLAVVLAAAYLHDIGIHEAEKKYNSPAAKYQEQEGPPIARSIMIKETLNFKVLYDADLITNLEEKHKENPIDNDRLISIIEKSFLTDSGREEAKKTLLN